MSQQYEQIGQESPELARVTAEKQGWQGSPAQPMGQEITDASDFSFRDRRANQQALGRTIPNMAAHSEPSMAARSVTPPARDGNDPQKPEAFWPR